MASVLLYKLGSFLAKHLPTGLSESITELLARIHYVVWPRTRRVIEGNLRVVLGPDVPESELRRQSRTVVSNFAKSIYCFLRLPYIDRDELLRASDDGGLEAITSRLRARGGFLIVGPHVGMWEVGGALLSAMGVEIHTVALNHRSTQVTRFFENRRRGVGVYSVPIGRYLQSLLRALERGKGVALLIDRAYGGRRRSYDWFGRKVDLPVGYATLAVRCGAPIVTAICVMDEEGRFKFEHGGPYYPDRSRGEALAVAELQERCMADMERYIREYPEQWFHFDAFGHDGKNR